MSELAEYLETLKGGIPDTLAGYTLEQIQEEYDHAMEEAEEWANGTPEDLASKLLLIGAQLALKAMGTKIKGRVPFFTVEMAGTDKAKVK